MFIVRDFGTLYNTGLLSSGMEIFVYWRNDPFISQRAMLRKATLLKVIPLDLLPEHVAKRYAEVLIGDRFAKIPFEDIHMSEAEEYIDSIPKRYHPRLKEELDQEIEKFLNF